MRIEIPGYKTLELSYLLLDYNGTIAVDGAIPEEVKERLRVLAEEFKIYVLTADTHGTAEQRCEGLPVTIMTFPSANAMDAKLEIARKLGVDKCAALGNGRNDGLMCRACALSVAIIGEEGGYSRLMQDADICVTSIVDGLELLLKPKRLVATLRG